MMFLKKILIIIEKLTLASFNYQKKRSLKLLMLLSGENIISLF